MNFRHKAIYGMTGQGKSWLLKRISKGLLKYLQKVIVFSGVADHEGWPRGTKYTEDLDELEAWLLDPANFGAHVILDEAAILYAEVKEKKHPTIYWLFMKGRHKGYTVYMATQYPTSVPRRNRINCAECYCFKLGDIEAAKQVWEDYGRPSYEGRPIWEIIQQLPKCTYLHIVDGQVIQGAL